jgi:SAM-dependent methyltransferase
MSMTDAAKAALLACPHCRGPLGIADDRATCAPCARVFPVNDGVICFSASDPFYDQYLTEHCPFALSPHGAKALLLRMLPFWSWREWRFWRSVVPRCERLLDFGCARGREIFIERAHTTVGLDVSLSFVRECARHYDLAAQGSLPNLPFAANSFDVVASSHVIGHVAREHKDELVRDIARVLRPGGITAHIIETDSDHDLVRAAKRNPETYRRQFVEQDGHIGLEHADSVLARFRAQGFRLEKMMLVDALVPSLLNYRKYLSHPEFALIDGMGRLQRMDSVVTSSGLVNAAYEVGMGIFHRTLEQWFGKPANAQFILVAFRKV